MKRTVLMLTLLLLFMLSLSSGAFACQTWLYGGEPRTCSCIASLSGWCQCSGGDTCTGDCICIDGKCGNCGDGPDAKSCGSTVGASASTASPLGKMWREWAWIKDARLSEQVRAASPALALLISHEQAKPTGSKSTIRGGTFLISDDEDVWAEWEGRLAVENGTPVIHFRIVRIAYPNRVHEELEPAVRYEPYSGPSELVIGEHGWTVLDSGENKAAEGTF